MESILIGIYNCYFGRFFVGENTLILNVSFNKEYSLAEQERLAKNLRERATEKQ